MKELLILQWRPAANAELHQVILHAGQTLIIGRDEAADINLPGDFISRRHAQIVCDGDSCTVLDLSSANGIHLNGRKVGRAALRPHSRLQIGQHMLLCLPAMGEQRSLPVAEVPAAAPAPTEASQAPAKGSVVFSGQLQTIALGELLQLYGQMGKTGRLQLRSARYSGHLLLHGGRLVSVALPQVGNPRKALRRLLFLQAGQFSFEALPEEEVRQAQPNLGHEATERLLLEELKESDELHHLLAEHNWQLSTVFSAALPLRPSLTALDSTLLALFQGCLNHQSLEHLLDSHSAEDKALVAALRQLQAQGYIEARTPAAPAK